MGVIYASVDVEKYTPEDNGTCILSGWRGSESSGDIDIQLLADNEVIPLSKLQYQERWDVFNVCPTLDRTDARVGFELSIDNLSTLVTNYEKFELVCIQGTDKSMIWEKSSDELRYSFGQGTLVRKIDSVNRQGSHMVIIGWLIDYLNSHKISVEDEHGSVLESNFKSISRPDVSQTYDVGRSFVTGFEISVNTKNMDGHIIRLHFHNGIAEKYSTIDLKKFDRDNSSYGRLKNTLRLSKRKENVKIIRKHGFLYFLKFVREQMEGDPLDYEVWRLHHMPDEKELRKQRLYEFPYKPRISIAIPLYNTPIQYLKELLDSIVGQTYGNWELCLADGSTDDKVKQFIEERYKLEKRICYRKLKHNKGIAGNTNEAVEMVSGDYVMLCDHDDLVAPNALYEMVDALNKEQSIDIIYTDEDLVNMDSTVYSSPRFKPDFNIDFLRSINYICHIFMVRKSILDEVGCFREEFDGAQDYDFILRCCEKTNKICHIPKVLYHWRAHENSTAGNPESKQYAIDAGKRALEQHYQRVGIDAEVKYTGIFIMYQTVPRIKDNPKISIIIPSKDHTDDLDNCITSIETKSTWNNYEIIVVENNSEEPETFDYYEYLKKKYLNVNIVCWKDSFNYSAINNFGIQHADGDYYILLNNDTEVITPQWMEYMLGYCQREDVGIVGSKLYYPDETVQHCGVVIGVGGFAGHILTQTGRRDTGYFGRLKAIQDISAVTAACMMIKKASYDAVHGLDENFKVALNDVDLCLKVRETGKLVVLNPWAELYHYESKSRGMEDDPIKHERFKNEIVRFRDKWSNIIETGDPYYNKNMTLMYGDCSLRGKHEHFDIIDEISGGR